MSEEKEAIKVLAEIKSYFEKKLSELEQEILMLRSFLKVVDDLLVEKSFKKIEIPKAQPTSVMPITSSDGVHLCDLYVTEDELTVLPNSGIKFDINIPPFTTFLIKKVLEPMQAKDKEIASKGEITPDKIISFRIETEENYLKGLTIKNYRNGKRLNELKNAIKWTFRKMYEKIS